MCSAYHLQSQGAIESCHQTLKTMVRTYCASCAGDWDAAMPFLLFAIRDAVNDSCFGPFELVYGHEVSGPLKLMKERESDQCNLLHYVSVFKDRLSAACKVARANIEGAKELIKDQFNNKAVVGSFSVGEMVLVLMPLRGNKLATHFCGPYSIVKQVREHYYVLNTADHRKSCPFLKKYHERGTSDTVCNVVLSHLNVMVFH